MCYVQWFMFFMVTCVKYAFTGSDITFVVTLRIKDRIESNDLWHILLYINSRMVYDTDYYISIDIQTNTTYIQVC